MAPKKRQEKLTLAQLEELREEAMAEDVVSMLEDPAAITSKIMTRPNFTEAFAGFTGLQEVEAPTVIVGESNDDTDDNSNDEAW